MDLRFLRFNNTVGAGAGNVLNYNLLKTVVLNKMNRNDGVENYDQEPQILFQENTLGNFKKQGFLKQDFTEHFFAECTAVKPMWEEIEKVLCNLHRKMYTIISILDTSGNWQLHSLRQ